MVGLADWKILETPKCKKGDMSTVEDRIFDATKEVFRKSLEEGLLQWR